MRFSFFTKRLFPLVGLVAFTLFLLGFLQASLVPLGLYGFYTLTRFAGASNNLHHYPHADNLRYSLQKFTGPLATAFAIFVVCVPAPDQFLEQQNLLPLAAQAIFVTGYLCVAFHFLNGLWNLLLTWGILI